MSAETLDALEMFPHQPPMEFAFGKNPVNGSFMITLPRALIVYFAGYLHRGDVLSDAPTEGGFATRALSALVLSRKANGTSETLRERDREIHG
jgi:hypothetical protein